MVETTPVKNADTWLAEKLEDVAPLDDVAPRTTFADLKDFYKQGNHVLVVGKTGAGKTVMLLTFVRDFLEHGFKVIHRDDGGLEFLKLAKIVDEIFVWIPQGCKFTIEASNVRVNEFDPEQPFKFVEFLLDTVHQFNVIVYDAYVVDDELSAEFWAGFLKATVKLLQQRHYRDKAKVVLSIDEMNDLLQPTHQELTKKHAEVRARLDQNIRKLRKHGVKLLCSSHRPNQLTLNTRSQFSFVFLKRSFGYDLYAFLNKELVTVGAKTFWRILKTIKSLPVQYAFGFDPDGNFDRFFFKNLPEDMPYYRLSGWLESPRPENVAGWDRVRIWVTSVLRALNNQVKYGNVLYADIEKLVGYQKGHIFNVIQDKLLSDAKLRLEWDGLVKVLPIPQRKKIRKRAESPSA